MQTIELLKSVEKAITDLHQSWADQIQLNWKPRALTSPCMLVLDTDGMEQGAVSIESVVHAQLVVNIKMADEWSWGFGDIIGSMNDGTNRIQQTGLCYIPEVLSIMDSTFGRTCPPIGELRESIVFQELRELFILWLDTDVPQSRGQGVAIREMANGQLSDTIDQAISAMLQQLETGRNPMLHPDERPNRSNYTPRISVSGNTLTLAITAGGIEHVALVAFDSVSAAQSAKDNPDVYMAVIWKLTASMDSETAPVVVESLPVQFSEETTNFQALHNFTTCEMAEILLRGTTWRREAR